jgi:hypothetical protein
MIEMIRRVGRALAWTALILLLSGDGWLAWRTLSAPDEPVVPLIARNREDVMQAAVQLEPHQWGTIDTLALSAWGGLHLAAGLGFWITRRPR